MQLKEIDAEIFVQSICQVKLIVCYVFISCNIGDNGLALAEAVHGTAPDIAGKVGS